MMQRTSRPWATVIDAATMQKRHKLFVDGRLVLFPFGLALLGLFVHGFISFLFFGLAIVVFALARWQFEHYPWALDDFAAEMSLPPRLDDIA